MKTNELLEGMQKRTGPGKTMKWQDRFFVVDDGWTKKELLGEMGWRLDIDQEHPELLSGIKPNTIPDELMHWAVVKVREAVVAGHEHGYDSYEEAMYILVREAANRLGVEVPPS